MSIARSYEWTIAGQLVKATNESEDIIIISVSTGHYFPDLRNGILVLESF